MFTPRTRSAPLRGNVKKLVVVTGMLGAFVLGTCTPASSLWDYPRMRAARGHLFAARDELRQASGIRGGRRERAIEHVNKAIEECDHAIDDKY